jgi:hypothetical protein
VRLWPRRGETLEAKSDAVLPEHIWEQVIAAGDAGGLGGLERAVGLPAVLAVIRLISHAVGARAAARRQRRPAPGPGV